MKKGAVLFLLLIWLGALGYGHYQVSNRIRIEDQAREGVMLPPLSRLDPRVINALTLGHRGVYDDFIHIWFNHYLADDAFLKKYPAAAVQIGDTLIKQRPMIETSYMLTCVAFLTDINKPEYCEPVIQTGMKIFPKSFMLPMAQGFIFYKHLNDPIRAAAYYAMAAQTEKAPPHVIRVAEKLLSKQELNESELDSMTFDFNNLFGQEALRELMRKQKEKPND